MTLSRYGNGVPDRWRLPGQFDLKLGAVVLDLEFNFQMDLIRDVRDEPQVLPLDHHIIVGASSSAIACRRAAASSRDSVVSFNSISSI